MQAGVLGHLTRNLLVALLLVAATGAGAQSEQYGTDYIIVARGMTLTRIMREHYPQQRRNWPRLMEQIIRTNPHAFVNGAPASLKLGMRLTLPRQVPPRGTTAQAASSNSTSQSQAAGSRATTSQSGTVNVAAPKVGVRLDAGAAATAGSTTTRTATTGAATQSRQPSTTTRATTATPLPAQQPVAALPPPVEQGGQEGSGAGQATVTNAGSGESGEGERPPWWWIIAALAMAALVL